MEVEQPDSGPASSSGSSGSPSSSAAAIIHWVKPQSLGSKWTAEVWGTDLFMVSEKVIAENQRYVKCVSCEQVYKDNGTARLGWEKGL